MDESANVGLSLYLEIYRSFLMKIAARKLLALTSPGIGVVALALFVCLVLPSDAQADEEYAKTQLKAMSDYLVSQPAISFLYDSDFEVVTQDQQKLTLASSGTAVLERPDKIHATRVGGFVNVEMIFDGSTLTLLGRNANVYTQVDLPGTIDNLIDELRDKYGVPLPAADLLLSNVYEELMRDVIDVKDLGSGVIGGTECDHFAFRTAEVDWQIWIAQGNQPYPCRYVITTKQVADSPQYSIQVADWKAGDEVATDEFAFDNTTSAERIEVGEIRELGDLPENYSIGATP
jgi:hypothetical protein